ncbi:MAG: hypothetical protein KA154_20505, partial [Gemmatimonadaceae bacterium]|nr:hypothetical protein [Gemmatimonadaceae bacterium]
MAGHRHSAIAPNATQSMGGGARATMRWCFLPQRGLLDCIGSRSQSHIAIGGGDAGEHVAIGNLLAG